jgi:dUTP pyrophosphatase
VRRLRGGVPLPRYAHRGDAGADLAIAEDVQLAPGERRLVRTGVALVIPEGSVGLVVPRSGLAARAGLTIVNSPGVIDSGYRGEVMVCLLNTDQTDVIDLRRGDLIAQLLVQEVAEVRFDEVEELPPSERGVGGHGSTGGISMWNPTSEKEQG